MSAPAPVRLLARTIRATVLTARAVLAAALAVFLLAGLPYGLIRYIGWPLPHHLASLGQLKKDVTGPVLGDQIYLDVIAIVIWLLWLLITVSFAAETIALLRGVELPPIPGLRPTQALAVILLTTIGITALMARVAAPAQAATTAPQVPARTPAASAPLSPGTAQAESTASAASADTPGPSPAHPAEPTHTVVSGDNLYDIARADYGNGDDWKILYTINAGHTQPDGQKLTDPSLIQPGWVLATSEPAPTTTSAPSQHTTHPDTTPSKSAPPGSPSTTPVPTVSQTPTHSAPGQTGTGGTPAPHSPAHSTAHGGHRPAPPSAASSEWIELAEGGALAAGVLAALTLALARARRRRRWHGTCYWPTPGEHQAEPLTVPVPLRPAPRQAAQHSTDADELDEFGAPTSAQPPVADQEPVATALEDAASESTPTCRGAAGTREEDRADLEDAGPARITVAAVDGRTLALQELPPAIALTGPGAMGAARAITAATVSAAEHRHDGARLLISRQDLALLLEGRAPDLPGRPAAVADLELFDDGPSAVTQLEAYTAYRTRLLEEHDATALEEILDEDDFPPVVLLAVARPETAERVASTLAAGAGLRVHAILLGEHSGATNWHVDVDGHLSGPDAPHGATSFRLSAGALEAALAVLTAASGEDLADQAPPTAPDPLGELAVPETELEPSTVIPEADAGPQAGAEETVALESPGADDAEAQVSEDAAEDPDTTSSEAAGTLSLTPVGSPTPAAAAAHNEPVVAGGVLDPARAETGPLLLVADSGLDRIAEITEGYAARPVQIKVLGVRAIITPTGSIDARLRGDAWRAAMKLALAGRHGQSLDDFATLWPDQDDTALRGTVKNAIYDLRKTLRARCGDSAGNPNRYIVQANHRYAFNTESVAVDLTAFTALRAVAAQARDASERRAAATAALDLYDGDLLAGQEEEWMIAPRTKTRRDALATATLLAQLADRAGDPDTAITWWERALEIDDNEEVYRQIIILQLRLRHHADAVATCDLLLARLDADGLAPAPETMAVIARARGRQPMGERTHPAGRRVA
jgi:DNA-binding SARP family transcriptional activator/LysM repeat protein